MKTTTQPSPQSVPLQARLSHKGDRRLRQIAAVYGLKPSAVIEMLLTEKAQAMGLPEDEATSAPTATR